MTTDTATAVSPPPAPQRTLPAQTDRAYFRKELVQIPFIVNGKPVGWQVLDGNRGVQVYDLSRPEHVAIVEGLRAAARAHRGGIVEISEATFADLKKKHPFKVARPGQPQLQAIPSPLDAVPKVAPRKQDAAALKAKLRALGVPIIDPPKPGKGPAITAPPPGAPDPTAPVSMGPVPPADLVGAPRVSGQPTGRVKRLPVRTAKPQAEAPPPPAE